MRLQYLLAVSASALALFFSPLPASADTILVDVNGSGDYLTIKEAVQAASDGDTVLIAPGEYVGVLNRGIDPYGKNLAIIGVAGRDSTIIDIEGDGRAFRFETGEDSTTVVQGLTMTGGAGVPGAAVNCEGSSPTFIDCAFTDCHAGGGGGGGVRCDDASPTFTDCSFAQNMASYGGGLIIKGTSSVRLTNVVFEDNYAEWSGGFRGEEGEAVLTNVVFRNNESINTAGGMGAFNGVYSLDGCVFVGNRANTRTGGGMACGYAKVTVTGCTFVGNSGASGSSIGCTVVADLHVSNSILSYGLSGGVLDCTDSTPWVTHCCVYGNAGGDSLCGDHYENLFANPRFCNRPAGNLSLYDISECLPENNPWGVRIGAYGEGCQHPGPMDPPVDFWVTSYDNLVTGGWNSIPDTLLSHYSLERDTSSAFGPETVAFATTDTVFEDGPFADGETYYYRVMGVDWFDVVGEPSETLSVFIEPNPPGAPVGLAAAAGDELVTLSWIANQEPDMDHYVVYRDTQSGFVPDEVYASTPEHTFEDSGVANYTSYYYRVAAVDTGGLASEPSDEVRAVPHGRPPAVVGLEGEPGDTSVTLTWRRLVPACQDHYKVYRDTTPDMLSVVAFYDGFELYETGLPPPDPPWNTVTQTGTSVTVTETHQAQGQRGLALRDSSAGYLRLFTTVGDSGSHFPRIKFVVWPGPAGRETNRCQFEIFTEDGIGYPAGVLEVCDGHLRHWVVGTEPETLGVCEPEEWHLVEWFLDCDADTYGVHLDGRRLAGGVPFFNDGESLGIFQMRTRSLDWGEAWVDEIFVGDHVQSIGVSEDTTYLDEPLTPEVTYYYKVAAVDTFGVEGFPSEVIAVVPGMTGVDGGEDDEVLATSFSSARPNPFSSATELAFTVPGPGADVDLRIYDVSGRLVRTLAVGRHEPGVYRLVWNGLDESGQRVASGVYFSRVFIGEWRATRKMVLLR